jgi:PAS domain S-box-containing protein
MPFPLQQRDIGGLRGRFVGALVLLASLILSLAISTNTLGEHPLVLLTLPLALMAIRFGIKGGLAMGVLTSVVATAWWFDQARTGGAVWIGSRVVTYLMIGIVIGWVADSRVTLLRKLANHNELSLDLIATASFDGYFTQLNPSFSRTLGFTIEELMQRPLLEFVHPDDREPTLQAIRDQTEQGREIFHFQNRYLTKDGGYRWLEWTSRPDSSAKELVAVARDVTERKRLEAFEREHKRLLERAVDARTQELRLRNSELEKARRETLHRLAQAAEFRDDDTHQHTERIGRAAALVAAQLGWPEPDILLLRDAAPLHDIGKLGVSDKVLLKPARLSKDEFEHVKRHAAIGAALLAGSDSPVLQMAEEIARAHHEWWDGSGYPLGLAGDEIPLVARIVGVVDVFDALTHLRPYKAAWPIEDAIAEIHRLAGRQFDPRVVEAFDELDPRSLVELPAQHGPGTRLSAVA